MRYNYIPKNELEKFGEKVYNLLVENFPQTFFVGGMVRDLLLERRIVDIDIATSATPKQITTILDSNKVQFNDQYKHFGNVIAHDSKMSVEITSFREDLRGDNRYHKIRFVGSPKIDSQRRDFAVNSLYLQLNNKEILDFQGGLNDIQKKQIRFIGDAKKRILQDPLRIVRALRFALVLNFKLESKTKLAIKNNFSEVKNLTKSKIEKEFLKIKNEGQKNILKKVINNPAYLDKYFI